MDKDTLERLRARASQHFLDSIAVKQEAEKILPEQVARGIVAMTECLRSGGKVMACGNGGSAADAQHFAAELIGRFERERQELAAIALTTDTSILTAVGNDYSYDEIFSKQVRGLGKKGDILIGISTSGNSKNLVKAIEAAKNSDSKSATRVKTPNQIHVLRPDVNVTAAQLVQAPNGTITEEGLFEIKTKDDVQIDKGKYIVLWKKEDGKWKLHRDLSNSDLPLATK